MKRTLLSLFLAVSSTPLFAAEPVVRNLSYTADGTSFESTVTWIDDNTGPRPGILMVPNWMGPTAESLEKAQMVAEMGYVVMMVDMYGVEVRPTNGEEAGRAAGKIRADRELMRSRAHLALERFRGEEGIPLKDDKVAAIGFCFGGGTVLELARSGAEVDAVVSFHGDLLSPTLDNDSKNIKSKVLVLHGAEDPYVPQADVSQFIEAMLTTEADWQLVQLSGAVHSFTNPYANSPGSAYDKTASDRAFRYMRSLLEEIWK